MPTYAKDAAGNIYETDAQGNAIRLHQPAQPSGFIPFNVPQPVLDKNTADLQGTQLANQGKATSNQVSMATAPADIALKNFAAKESSLKMFAGWQAAIDAQTQARARQLATIGQSDNVLGAIHRANSRINDGTTGLTGKVASYVPPIFGMGGQSYGLGQDLKTIGSNIAFDRYSAIKDNAPKGAQGGFRLTEQEIDLLKNSAGTLDQGAPASDLRTTLANLEQRYKRDAAQAAGVNPDDLNVQTQFGIAPTNPNSMLGRAQGLDKLAGIHPKDAQKAYFDGLAVLAQKTARLTPYQKQIALQTYMNTPRMMALRRYAAMPENASTAAPPVKTNHPADVEAILQQYGNQ